MKFKLILNIAALLVLAGVALGQAVPKIAIAKTEQNLGEIKKGAVATYSYVFKNEGKADLEIKNVAPACGCTASDFTKSVPPGQEGKITLSVNTSNFIGAIAKAAEVYTNDPQRERLTLVLSMVVTADELPQGRQIGPFIVGPSNQSILRAPQGMSASSLMTIANLSANPIRITKVIPNGGVFAVTLNTLADGKRYTLGYTSSTNLPIGSHKQTVKLATDSPEAPELEIFLEVVVSEAVSINPDKLVFENVPVSDPEMEISLVSKFLWVKLGRGVGLEIKNISSDLPFVKAKIETSDSNGQSIVLRVGFNAKPPAGAHKGVIKIETNHPTAKAIEVPISVTAK